MQEQSIAKGNNPSKNSKSRLFEQVIIFLFLIYQPMSDTQNLLDYFFLCLSWWEIDTFCFYPVLSVLQGFAQAIGNFLVMFQCAAHSDPITLGKITQGLAMVGLCIELIHCSSFIYGMMLFVMFFWLLSNEPQFGFFWSPN